MARDRHDHDHDEASARRSSLTSVGVDIGSSTSHLLFSQLAVGYPAPHERRPAILERRVIGRSPILFTPFSADWTIEPAPLRELVESAFAAAALDRAAIDTGAVIVTGEAARRDNARRIAEMFSDEAGRFVCAVAGPRLEAVLAAHGSGAVGRSRDEGTTIANIDLGGGTTKVSLIARGRIEGSAALNLGARLLACNERGELVRLEKWGERFAEASGCRLRIGAPIAREALSRIGARMARVLFDVLEGAEPPWPDLFLFPPFGGMPKVDGIVFSGGVAEYVYGREGREFGDLGLLLGCEVREQARRRGYRILEGSHGIRATVIGASQFSMQLSGETIFVPDERRLPMRNLRVVRVEVGWDPPVARRAAQAIAAVLAGLDPEVRGLPFALVFSSPPFVGYGAAQELADGIREALRPLPPGARPALLAFEQNVGRIVGELLAPEFDLPSIDEISLSELDFIDVGEPLPGQDCVPVVIKTLAFGA